MRRVVTENDGLRRYHVDGFDVLILAEMVEEMGSWASSPLSASDRLREHVALEPLGQHLVEFLDILFELLGHHLASVTTTHEEPRRIRSGHIARCVSRLALVRHEMKIAAPMHDCSLLDSVPASHVSSPIFYSTRLSPAGDASTCPDRRPLLPRLFRPLARLHWCNGRLVAGQHLTQERPSHQLLNIAHQQPLVW